MDWNLVVSIAGVLIAAFAFVQWWTREATRVRQAVRDAAPSIDFHVGSYGGAGEGYTVRIANRGTAQAVHGSVYLPGIDGAAFQIEEMPPGFSREFNIPLDRDAAPRTTLLPQAEVTFSYKDRFGLEYMQALQLTQTPRADGRFNLGTNGAPRHTRPAVGWRGIWQLRREA